MLGTYARRAAVSVAMAGLAALAAACGGGGGGGGSAPTVDARATPDPDAPPTVEDPPELSPTSHPKLFMNALELDELGELIDRGMSPLPEQFASLLFGARQGVPPDPEQPDDVYLGTNIDEFRERFDADTREALRRAIAVSVPGQVNSIERQLMLEEIRDYLLSWARHALPGVTRVADFCRSNECFRGETGLYLSTGANPYVLAYDLVHDDPVLDDADRAAIDAWLEKLHALIREATFVWAGGPPAGGPNRCHRLANHATHHIAALVAIGYVLDDADKVEDAIRGGSLPYTWSSLLRDVIYRAGDRALGCEGPLPTHEGELYDRYRHFDVPGIVNDPNAPASTWNDSNRGYGYSLITLQNLALVAELALHHGRDLYRSRAPSGESMDIASKYLAQFKESMGPGRKIITPSGIPGEGFYVGEVMKDGYNDTFELMSDRYHHHSDITRALRPYDEIRAPRRYFHLPFFGRSYTPGYLSWDFHLERIDEGWEPSSPDQLEDLEIAGGVLRFESRGDVPEFVLRPLALRAEEYASLVVEMRVTSVDPDAPEDPGSARFAWVDTSGSGGDREVYFPYLIDGNYHLYTVPLDTQPEWSAEDNRIFELAFTPVDRPDLQVEIDAIRLEGP